MTSPHKGITYDTGFEPYGPANSSRKLFDAEVVQRELQIIAHDLHCSHVRITGADPGRILSRPVAPSKRAWRFGSHHFPAI
jgi:hypothetical protein